MPTIFSCSFFYEILMLALNFYSILIYDALCFSVNFYFLMFLLQGFVLEDATGLSLTASLRFDGALNVDVNEFQTYSHISII